MPLVPFIDFFGCGLSVGVRTQGPDDFLLPGGPMSCQSAPGVCSSSHMVPKMLLFPLLLRGFDWKYDAPGTFFIGFFEFGQGHRGPMIPYCPGAP
ncbi:unnamed protein product, partial [Staurois parvus]